MRRASLWLQQRASDDGRFPRHMIRLVHAAAGFVGLDATTATITQKENREYPVFLISGRRPG
jgi:hypothetical protein